MVVRLEGDEVTKCPSKNERFDLRDKNIVATKFWAYDLQGRLKAGEHPPGEYHGHPRIYIKEDIEEDVENNKFISYLRVYYGKNLLAQTARVYQRYVPTYLGDAYEVQDNFEVVQTIRFLLDKDKVGYGWETCKIDSKFRTKKKASIKPKRKVVKKSIKKVVRKLKPKKRK